MVQEARERHKIDHGSAELDDLDDSELAQAPNEAASKTTSSFTSMSSTAVPMGRGVTRTCRKIVELLPALTLDEINVIKQLNRETAYESLSYFMTVYNS
jgi:hypothetical protein